MVTANHGPVGWNNNHVQLVGRLKLGCLGFRRTSHAGKFFVETEIILQRDSRKGLVFLLDPYALFRFDRLVQTIRPAPTFHQSSSEVVNNDYFAVLDHVLMIESIERVCLQGLLDAME